MINQEIEMAAAACGAAPSDARIEATVYIHPKDREAFDAMVECLDRLGYPADVSQQAGGTWVYSYSTTPGAYQRVCIFGRSHWCV